MRKLFIVLAGLTVIVLFAPSVGAKLPENQGFSIAVQLDDGGGRESSTADYLYNLPSGGHWLPGDRSGYDCAYTFLEWRNEIVARVAFHRVTSAESYTEINDRYMQEGVRYYDGTLNTDSRVNDTGTAGLANTSTRDACVNNEIAYTGLSVMPSLPVMQFFDTRDGTLIETRNYANVQVEGELSFAIIEQSAARTAVGVFYDGEAVGVVYYTPLSPSILMTTNGALPPSPTITPPPPTSPPKIPSPSTGKQSDRRSKGCDTKKCH